MKYEKTPRGRDRPPQPRGFVHRWFWPLLGGILGIGALANALVWFWPAPEGAGGAAAELDLPSYPVEQVAVGRSLYDATCADCHGPDGEGNAAAGVPALNGTMHAWHHPDSQIAGFVRNGVGAMPPVAADWSDEDIDAVLAYVKQWWEPELLAHQTRASMQNP